MSDFPEDKSMPWQIKAIGFIGVPSVIALYTVWALVGDLKSGQLRIEESQLKLGQAISSLVVETQSERNEQRYYLNDMRTAMQANCINEAATTTESDKCLGWRALVP